MWLATFLSLLSTIDQFAACSGAWQALQASGRMQWVYEGVRLLVRVPGGGFGAGKVVPMLTCSSSCIVLG